MAQDPRGDTPVPAFGDGRFTVKGTLGIGGAGVVYRAYDQQLGREVALKWLRQASGRDLLRFKREFRALADIVHPNLVALHELHATDGNWFFTMDIVEGVSFLDWVRPPRGGGGPTRTRADIIGAAINEQRLRGALIQLTDALIALHRAGKLHRDLKPSNVLVTPQGRLALLDFGLVAQITEDDPESLAVGTPVYMSPEQAADQPLGETSDWYAVGCMLYEALTGRRPFEGEPEQVMIRKQTEVPKYPTDLAPRTPPDLARLCMALCQPAAPDRPKGMQILTQLGAAPSATTRRLARSLPPVAFVGREAEIDVLRRGLADARRCGVTVIVKGRSGIGKSTLVKRFVRELGDAVVALEGRCFEREAVPFKMLDGVVDALTTVLVGLPVSVQGAIVPKEIGSLARLFPVVRRIPLIAEAADRASEPIDPQELRRRGFIALRVVLTRLARTKPVVISLDDAHWGDADSCTFLAELIHAGEPGVLVVIAQRPEDYLGVIAQLRKPPGGSGRRGDLRDLDVQPLPEAEALALIAQLAPETTGEQGPAIVAAAMGNPFALVEMARVGALAAGMKMDDLVRARVQRLAPDARALLAVSSVAARPLPLAIAAHAAGCANAYATAAQLASERLATLRGVGVDAILHPAHDYVRSAVLAGLGTEARASYHEALARAFEEVQGAERLDSLSVVEHWLSAGHPANAAHHAVTAAVHAEDAFAFKRAAELYQIALTFGPWDVEELRDLTARKAHALTCAGQLDAAVTEYQLAAQMIVDARAIDLERLRVETLLRRGRIGEALPAAEKLLAQIGLRVPLTSRASRTRLATQWVQSKLRGLDFTERSIDDVPAAQLLATDVLYSIASGLAFADPTLGRVVQSELLRCALAAGEPIRVCLALGQELIYSAMQGSRARGAVETVATKLGTVTRNLRLPRLVAIADNAIGIAAHATGRWGEARAKLDAGLAVLRDHGAGMRWEINIGEMYYLATLFYLGEWREMARQTQLLLRDAIERGDVIAQQFLRSGRCTFAWLILARPEEARAQLELANKTLGEDFHLTHVHAISAASNLELAAGDAAGAAHRLRDAWAQIERIGVLRMQLPRVELTLLRARIALAGEPPRTREARMLADEMLGEGVPWARALGTLLTAACGAWDGDKVAAVRDLVAAEAELDDAGMEGYLQIARLYHGQLEGGPAGLERVTAAREALSDLGAATPESLARHLMPWPRDDASVFE